eukprot:8835532-Karenia_brevis.AAC.1
MVMMMMMTTMTMTMTVTVTMIMTMMRNKLVTLPRCHCSASEVQACAADGLLHVTTWEPFTLIHTRPGPTLRNNYWA